MTNEEKARKYLLKEHLSPLNNILHQCDLKTELQYHKDIETAFIKGAEWKDKQHAQEKQQWIENACNTIKYLLGGYVIRNFNFGDSYDMDELIDDFRKAMKEG